MEYVLTKKERAIVEAEVTIDGEVWAKAQKKSFNKLANNLQVQGFRKGKVPYDMAKRYIDPRKVLADAIDLVLQDGYTYVLDNEKEIEVMAQPDVAIKDVNEEKLVVVYSLTVRPEVTLGQYKDLEIKKEAVEVTEEDVNAELAKIQDKNAELVVSEEPVKMGDTVNLDFKGYVDGEAFEGGEAKGFDLVIGSGQFIPGFEEGLVGTKTGEEKDVEITFPENYVPALAGQKATFKCKINSVKAKNLPELDDNLALDENIDGVSTLEELKAHLSNQVKERKEKASENAAYETLVNTIVDSSSVEIAEKLLNEDIKAQLENLKERAKQQGITYEQYLELTSQTEDDLKAKISENCERNLKTSFVFGAIAKENGVNVTKEDLDAEYTKIAESYKMDVETVKKALESRSNELVNNIFMSKIHELLVNNNKFN